MLPKWLACLVTGALILSACGSPESIPISGGLGAENSLEYTRWGLVSYGQPGSETPVMEGSGVILEFREGNQAGGSAGCNTFVAQYDVDGEWQLSMRSIASTLVACTNETLMRQEKQYLDALHSVQTFMYNDDGSLTIRYRDGVLNFSRLTSRIPRIVHT